LIEGLKQAFSDSSSSSILPDFENEDAINGEVQVKREQTFSRPFPSRHRERLDASQAA
jgi:hypothetical protein